MTKPMIPLCALLGIFCAQVFVTPATSHRVRDRNYIEAEDKNRVGDPAPDLNCVLFGTSACNATCNTLAHLYGVVSNGTCNALQSCVCKIEQKTDLKSLWNEKIKTTAISDQVLSEIEADPKSSSKVVEILLEFPQINEEMLDELQFEFFEIKNIDQLEAKKDTSPIMQYVPEKYKLNETELRKHLADFIQQSLKDQKFAIADTNYQLRVRDFLDRNYRDGYIKDDFIEQVRQTNNPSLYKFIDKRFAGDTYEYGFDDNYSYEYVPDFVAAAVNDEFVKFADDAAKLAPQRKHPIRPSLRTTFFRIPPKSKPSSTPNTVTSAQPTTYIASGFTDFTARIDKAPNGAVTIYWRGVDTILNHNLSVSGAVGQTWEFGNDVTIKFDLLPGGAIRQIWKIGDDNYKYERLDDGSIRESGHVSPDDKSHYQNRIEFWCRVNETFLESGDCAIYNKL